MDRKKCDATGKTIFESKSDAIGLIQSLKERQNIKTGGRRYKHRKGRPQQCRAYHCEYCDGFHLTKQWKWNRPDPMGKGYITSVQLFLIVGKDN